MVREGLQGARAWERRSLGEGTWDGEGSKEGAEREQRRREDIRTAYRGCSQIHEQNRHSHRVGRIKMWRENRRVTLLRVLFFISKMGMSTLGVRNVKEYE